MKFGSKRTTYYAAALVAAILHLISTNTNAYARDSYVHWLCVLRTCILYFTAIYFRDYILLCAMTCLRTWAFYFRPIIRSQARNQCERNHLFRSILSSTNRITVRQSITFYFSLYHNWCNLSSTNWCQIYQLISCLKLNWKSK